MIKVIINVTKVIVALVASLLFCSCNFSFRQVEGNGNVTTQKRAINESFQSVSIGHGLELIIEQSSQTSVTVEADENLLKHIKTEVRDGELVISSDANISSTTAKIIVSMPVIEGIESTSGSTVKGKNIIKSDNLELSSSSGSTMEVNVDVKSLSCDASSSGDIKVSGKAEKLETDVSSGSNIDAKDLVARIITSDASSGATSTVNPTESLTAEASSGGEINYVNTPSNLNKKISSGGSISEE
jgi:hypothetical protein